MLMPKRVKYRKQMRGRMRGKASRGAEVSFGEYGLQALEPCWMTSRQIEAARRSIVRYVRRGGKVWIRGEDEPEAWTVEARDDAPNRAGSPGLYGNANDAEITLDNIRVFSNAS